MGSSHPSTLNFSKAAEEATENATIATVVAMSGASNANILHVASRAEKAVNSAIAAQNAACREIENGGGKPPQGQKAERKTPAPRPIQLTLSPNFQPRILVKAQPQQKGVQTNPCANSIRDSPSLAEQSVCSVHSLGP